ncbi:pirin family protein [Burkholderia pseudomallei]|uniref:pirin family protein n=1 Tax=Burkholderia pseudomallei TaxID=28450 RepID=UPI00050E1945|nr:pirin family protein [Burkholderia pseudomallei]AIV91703.1 cupin domain protein [Burkholderia pseudomallei B03]AIV96000.1 cupin domain protein [Burkholderia pseudomallei A79A]KGC52545.1 cupin domain protein [Burkholderia pseudomallei]KGS56427.1 pirin family protein [Burkholderia pseudomallei MSHR5609]KGV72412.1 cupin domain protein [Burkholderia pseudomallei MSHR3964]
MFEIRRAGDRGHADHGWLDTHHSFSFADYRDPEHMHFGALRVLNDDRIAPTRGFGMHPHRDMEIVTYVLEGTLAHRDSMGNGSIVRAGDVQRMSAGTGIVHSEYNASRDAPLHLLQIWLLPVEPGGRPGYQEARFTDADKRGRLRLVASPDGRDGAVTVRADASIYAGLVDGDERAEFALPAGRRAYVHVARGCVVVNGEMLAAGDGARIAEVGRVVFERGERAEVLLFDLA